MDPIHTYALVIGINDYQSPNYPSLVAAVPDADNMDQWLRSVGVPKHNIINLRNRQATRDGILSAFDRLEDLPDSSDGEPQQKDDKSQPGPCFIIYYAGHGSRTKKPSEWRDWAADGDKVEVLCPYDMGSTPFGANYRMVEGIPDRTVCFLLNRLSKRRGNNVTLILDCCCSAGLNRGSPSGSSSRGTMRQLPESLCPPISGKTDPDVAIKKKVSLLQRTRGMRQASGFGGIFHDSHVLLAACGRDCSAYENAGHGLFTTALIGALENSNLNLETTTYQSLMSRLLMPMWQTPHCDGSNSNRPLFNRAGVRSDPSFIPGYRSTSRGLTTVTLNAGPAQGVVHGDLFSIHKHNFVETDTFKNPSEGILMAQKAFDYTSTTSTLVHPSGYPVFAIPKSFYAKRIDWHQVPMVYCNDEAWLKTIFPSEEKKIEIVAMEQDADLVFNVSGDKVTISRTEALSKKHKLNEFPDKFRRNTSQHAFHKFVEAWQHVNYHLTRVGGHDFKEVRMELHYLEKVPEADAFADMFSPENLRPNSDLPNLLGEEPATIIVPSEETPVGLTLINEGDIPLYPYLFYFDPGQLSITPWFLSPVGAGKGQVDAPLLPRSRLPIGYGNGSTAPWSFVFEEGSTKDIGIFKLFLSTAPANFDSIEKESPFPTLGDGTARGGSAGRNQDIQCLWGAKAATVIQVGPPKEGRGSADEEQ